MRKLEGEHVLSELWSLIENSKKYIPIEGTDTYMYQRKHPDKHGIITLIFGVQDGVAYTLEIRAGTVMINLGSNDIDHVFEDSDRIDLYMKNSGVTVNLG